MDLENQKVLVAGLGKSGMAAYELLKNMGAEVSLFDGKKDLDVSGYDAPVYLGEMTKEELAGFACAVFSPGVPLDIDLANELRELNIPIIGVGGITCAEDVLEFLNAGASAVEVGAQNFVDPYVCPKIIEDLPKVLEKYGYKNIEEAVGRSFK